MLFLLFCISLILFISFISSIEIPSHLHEKLIFFETFDNFSWTFSTNKKYKEQDIEIRGAVNAPIEFANDHGLVLNSPNRHYGVSQKLKDWLQVKDEDLVIQYELKLEDVLNCGGAYIKLLRPTSSNKDIQDIITNLAPDTPYSIMFGPDKCGATNKVHVIFQYQNPITQEWEEKHYNETVSVQGDKKSHTYTLHIRNNDDSFAIYTDKKLIKTGGLLTHLIPAIQPPATIDDPEDQKPADWVDEEKIPDPSVIKPADWDDDAPRKIVDPNASKPAGWLDSEPLEISDPEAFKPADWDDEEDGEYEAPMIPNPKCDAIGCGEWKPPLIPNPKFQGKWSPPLIDNPEYKGPWKPRQLPNPNFFEAQHPANSIAPIGAIAIEVWTTNNGIVFDNFVIAKDLQDAFEFADLTTGPKSIAEKKQEDLEKKNNSPKSPMLSIIDRLSDFSVDNYIKLLEELGNYVMVNPLPFIASFLAIALSLLIFRRNKRTLQQANESKPKKDEVTKVEDENKTEGKQE